MTTYQTKVLGLFTDMKYSGLFLERKLLTMSLLRNRVFNNNTKTDILIQVLNNLSENIKSFSFDTEFVHNFDVINALICFSLSQIYVKRQCI